MNEPRIQIYDIMACNVYVDYDFASQAEQHKFLVTFFPIGNAFLPEYIENVTAFGPDGYQVDFKNQEYNLKNINGYIVDKKFGSCWYMVNLPTGFMKEGEYKIEVTLKDGNIISKSRFQENAPGEKLLDAYMKSKEKILKSYNPGTLNPLKKVASLKNVKVKWKTLKDTTGVDAYYIFRISMGKTSTEFNIQKLIWWDNVFVHRLGQIDYGLNKGEVLIETELKPNTSYAYFVETTDSNAMGQTNICIFQPHQIFVTPSLSKEVLAAKNS